MPSRSPRTRCRQYPRTARAFTLIELLAVVGIIALLIGIFLPALSAARTEANRGATRSILGSIERGVEMFNSDFGAYPDSRLRPDPLKFAGHEKTDNPTQLTGAHWLARAMLGYDGLGIDYAGRMVDDNVHQYNMDPTTVPAKPNALNVFAVADPVDGRNAGPYSKRRGAYVDKIASANDNSKPFQNIANADPLRSPRRPDSNPVARPLLLDKFEYPILYYRANPRGTVPFVNAVMAGNGIRGVYSQEDNAQITGGAFRPDVVNNPGSVIDEINNLGWNFSGFVEPDGNDARGTHGLGYFGSLEAEYINNLDTPRYKGRSFVRYLHDESAFKADATPVANKMVKKAVRDSAFILISAGPDGIFGTTDDVNNIK